MFDAASATKFQEEREAERRAERDRQDKLYGEWLAVRAEQQSGKHDACDDPDAIYNALSAREYELARTIATTPAVYPWMVLRKFEVLTRYLVDGGGEWTDKREVMLLGGIHADVLRMASGTIEWPE